MPEDIIISHSSLEEEIEKKRIELSLLKNELADAELALATLENELSFFERRYNFRVGALIVELDRLKAQIAEAAAILSPYDEDLREKANDAKEQANRSFDESNSFFENHDTEELPKFVPTEDLKKLYRELAKGVHPDLAKNEIDRERRSTIMGKPFEVPGVPPITKSGGFFISC